MSPRLTEIESLRRDNKTLKETEAKTFQRVRQLERELKDIHHEQDTAENIRETIYRLGARSPDPPKWLARSREHGPPGVPMTMWSDFHWGETVNKAEVAGVNIFNRTVAKQRLNLLVEHTIDICTRHMVKPKYPGIIICVAGDLFTGTIHEEIRETNEGFVFEILYELQDQLASAITRMADAFGKVFLPCVVGNHGRTTMRPRFKGRVYTSYEWNLYCQLERYFRHDKRVQFLIPPETDCWFSCFGHRFLLTHGDSLGVKGGDGIIGAIGPIARGTIKVGRSEAQIGRDFDTLLIGQWHTYMPRSDACAVVVNGTLKGYDEYARLALRVPYARPSQALWFIHPRHGFTAQWPIYLDDVRRHAKSEWVTWHS